MTTKPTACGHPDYHEGYCEHPDCWNYHVDGLAAREREARERELDLETLPNPDGAGPTPGPEGWGAYWSKNRSHA